MAVPVKGSDNATYNVTPVTIGPANTAAAQAISMATDLANLEPAGAPITGAAMPTGGVGITGWLSAIWSKLGSVVLGAGTAVIGKVSIDQTTPGTTNAVAVIGRMSKVAVAPTISTTAYSAGKVVGGPMTFANVFDAAQSGILQSIVVRGKSVQTANLKLYLFNANPSASSFNDNGVPNLNINDVPKLLGCFPLGLSDNGLGTMTVWESDGIGAAISSTTTGLWGVLVTTSAPTFPTTSDLSVELRVLKD